MASGAGYWKGAVIATVAALVSLRPLEWLKERMLPQRAPARLIVELAEGVSSGPVLEAVERSGDLLAMRREGSQARARVAHRPRSPLESARRRGGTGRSRGGSLAALTALLCSRNEHKLGELRTALPGWTIELLDADEYPPETGETFAENARAKAVFGRSVGPPDAWVLGEDSGLEVVALGGGPGVETARWAQGRHVERILAALDGVADRRARYVCELVAIAPDGRELRGTGVLTGAIGFGARGSAGFGFDPVFVPDGEARTVAELGDDWKALHSHRARAARAMSDSLA